MSIKSLFVNRKGAISMELLLSICFLIVMVFFSYQMLTRQKDTIISANQEVEATGFLFEIKKILADQCTLNFAGLTASGRTNEINHIKEMIEYEDGTFKEVLHFSKKDAVIKNSKTGLRVEKYALANYSLKREKAEGRAYLHVSFSGKSNQKTFIKQVPLFFEKAENGAIKRCSLSPFARQLGLWLERDSLLVANQAVGFGIEELTSSLNIHSDGVYVEKGMSQCKGLDDSGSIFWDNEQRNWILCTSLGLEIVEDQTEVSLW